MPALHRKNGVRSTHRSWLLNIRHISLYLAIIGSLAFPLMTADATAKDLTSMPPLEPMGERYTPENAGFAAACRAALNGFPMTKDWKLGAQIVTHNDVWGPIWRADFEMNAGPIKPLINRIVCWKRDDGEITFVFGIGQTVSPL